MPATDDGYLRIGELSRRVGLAPELLRAWEKRYGLLRPSRSAGGFRLYSDRDEARLRVMQEQLARRLSAADAARFATAQDVAPAPADVSALAELRDALDRFDDVGANAAFDRSLAALSLDAVLTQLVLPFLRELGRRWERGKATVAQEHFASNIVRGRLLGLARGWDRGRGPRAVLACPPGEQHDLALIAFGLALRGQAWRITYLGPDTPVETLRETAAALKPEVVVLAAASARWFAGLERELAELGLGTPLELAGAGASAALAERTGAGLLEQDPVAAAERVARDQ